MADNDPKENNNAEADLSHLESQFGGAEEKAEAEHWYDFSRKSGGIKDYLRYWFPDLVAELEAVTEAVPPSESPDGQPIILTLAEAEEVAKQRPDLETSMKRIANTQTRIGLEQNEIDLERVRAKGDDKAEISRLQEEALALRRKADSARFWAAVIELHPISQEYRTEALPQYSTYHGLRAEVMMMQSIENEIERLGRIIIGHVAQAALQKGLKGEDAAATADDWTTNMIEVTTMAPKIVPDITKLIHLKKVKNDVIFGQTGSHVPTQHRDQSTKPALTAEPDQPPNKYLEILQNIPGIDPVREAMDKGLRGFPRKGWLIESTLYPGRSGDITVRQYTEDSLRAESIMGDEDSNEVDLWMDFPKDTHGYYNLIYRKAGSNSATDYRGLTSTSPKAIISLDNESELMGTARPMHALPSSLSKAIRWKNLSNYTEGDQCRINRLTDSAELAKQIVSQLGFAMGMSEADVEKLLKMFEEHDAFAPLQSKPELHIRLGGNPDTLIDPNTGKDPWGYTAEDHAEGRYYSHGIRYDGWNDPGTYDV